MPLLRKVLRVTAWDSPNVALALHELAEGKEPSGRVRVPGVITYDELQRRLATWDAPRVCVGVEGQFYEGAENLLFPALWLNRAEALAADLERRAAPRRAVAMGVDPGEGGSHSAWAVADRLGLIELHSLPTPDTSTITGTTLALMHKHGLAPSQVLFDRGGGGKQHADRLRSQGCDVRTVAFGEAVAPEPRRGMVPFSERSGDREARAAYKNRRAQMYGLLRERLDPSLGEGFALPARYAELRRQLGLIPLAYDNEGRLVLPPKQGKGGLVELLGRSPDESDALVLSVFGLSGGGRRPTAGVF